VSDDDAVHATVCIEAAMDLMPCYGAGSGSDVGYGAWCCLYRAARRPNGGVRVAWKDTGKLATARQLKEKSQVILNFCPSRER